MAFAGVPERRADMAYFPIMVDLCGKRVLIVGGGETAARKAAQLQDFGAEITVVAKELKAAFPKEASIIVRSFQSSDIEDNDSDIFLVIAATDDREVNQEVSGLSKKYRIPVNVVDDREASSFLFPSLIKKGSLSVGISTGGSSPSAAIYLKERFSQAVPENLPQILDFLAEQRVRAQQSIVQGERRERLMKELFCACMERGGPMTQEEARAWIEKAGEEKRWEKEA